MKRQDDPTLRLCGIVLGLLHEGGYLVHPTQEDEEVSTFRGWVLHVQYGGESKTKFLA